MTTVPNQLVPPLSSTRDEQSVRKLLADNAELTETLFADTDNDAISSPQQEAAAQMRRSIQWNYGPFAPPKRRRTTATDSDNIVANHLRSEAPPAAPFSDQGSNALSLISVQSSISNILPHSSLDTATQRAQIGAIVPHTSTQRGMDAMRERGAKLALEKPVWHPPWRPYRVISGHLGWVRAIAFDPSNEWFATGAADRTVKIWDTASGRLKLTLTGHIATVRAIQISPRHPYMFTVGEDKTVKCWDLEQNKVIRNYHGHLSGVYCAALHPTLDVLMTGGRDSTVRVWDMRTRLQVHVLGGHRDTVNAVLAQGVDPQIISASVDSTVRLWDLAAGRCMTTLTNHKRGVRALTAHPREFSFASASADAVKTWGLPDGVFMRNLTDGGRPKLINALAANEDGVLVSGGDDGTVSFWDYGSAHRFDTHKSVVQPGSLDCEAGIYALAFDHSGSRLVTGEADKTIRMWREDETATEETHPIELKRRAQR